MKAHGFSKLRNVPRSRRVKQVAGHSNLESFMNLEGSSSASQVHSASMEMILPQVIDAIVVCDDRGLIVLANAGAKQLAKVDPEGTTVKLAENIWGELFDFNGCHIAPEEWPLMRALRGETTSYLECRLVRPDGSACDILFSARPIADLAKRIVGAVATLTDISQHKRAEASQHEEALERERSRMATHIHDTVSQSLTAIMLQLRAAELELYGNLKTVEVYLQRATSVARDSLADLRSSIWTLSHESLETEDLSEALSFLAKQLFAATPVALELSLQQEGSTLPREVRHEILWISKEALANVMKHAKATKVHIELLCGKKDVQLRVGDDGQGFGQARVPNAKGSFGLISMRKRAERLGGTVVVDSQPGKGTRVVAVVPMQTAVIPSSVLGDRELLDPGHD
jgi:signal transduction histidine kinase